MDGTAPEIPSVHPPPDDEAIRQALTELDAKLAAFKAAMCAVRSQLEQSGHVDRCPPSSEPPSASRPEPAADAAPGPIEPQTQPKVVPQRPDPSVEAGASSPATPDRNEDDEELLASLDEETANAIRVMRRLKPQGTSVRELLEQYRATLPRPEAARPRKTSWFARRE